MSTYQGPTVRRRIVASELRRLRGEGGHKQQDVAKAVGIAPNALSRYEGCVSSMQVPVAENLFRFYGIDGEQLDALLELVRGSRKRGWLKGFAGVVPEWFEGLIALERDASKVHELAIRVVPGLLQTKAYATAILSAGSRADRLHDHLNIRMNRAELLTKESPPEYWAIICESALHCQVGGPTVMAEQLEHLHAISRLDNVTIQILPNELGAHRSMVCPYMLMRFSLAPNYGVVYLDYLTGSLYLDEPGEIEEYDNAYRHLIKASLSEQESRSLLSNVAKELKRAT